MRLHVEKAVTEADRLRLKPEWDDLVERSERATVFSTFEWADACWRHRPRDAEPWILKVYDGRDLVGLVPLRRRSGIGRPTVLEPMGLGGGWWADYLDVLSARGYEEAVMREWVRALGEDRSWDLVDWPELPLGSPSREGMTRAVESGGLHAVESPGVSCHSVPLPRSWSEYLSRLSPNMRSTLERKARKIVRECDARFERIEAADALDPVIAALHHFQDSRWSPAERAERRVYFEFLRELAPRMLARGWLDLRVIQVGGVPVSGIFSFRFRKTVSFYVLGFDPDPHWSKYSIGLLTVAEALKRGIEDGFDTFDLMRGDESYKGRFAAEPHPNVRIQIARTGPWRLYLGGRQMLSRLKARARAA